MDWTSFLRQLFLCSGTWAVYFINGLCTGFTTVLVPQLRRANVTITMEQASWLSALPPYCGFPWVIILSVLINVIGRKKSHTIVCISTVIPFVIFYYSTNINHFVIGSIFIGPVAASMLTTNLVILTEYISSKQRGIFLTIKSATFFWGILVANTIGTFFHWQYIVLLGLVCAVYALFNVIFWPESPLWLVEKGRIEECSAAHTWLKGNDEESQNELERLLKAHENKRFTEQQWKMKHLVTTVCRKQFLKPILLAYLFVCLYCFSGKTVCTIYAIDILKSISNSESTAYTGMLILDGVTVASMYLGCVLAKFLKRRMILIGFSIVGITVMISISIYLLLAKLIIINENKYVSIFLLATYSITIGCGPMVMCTAFIAELLPLKHRILAMCMVGLSHKLTYATYTKISPFIFKNLGIDGTFALYALLTMIVLSLIYYFVPETKDKTIQDIDDWLRGKEKVSEENDELMTMQSEK